MAPNSRINIRPGVSVLSVLRHLNYSYWHALGEFVDNALQSYLTNKDAITKADGVAHPLQVKIALSLADGGVITVRDNAAGIPRSEFSRAFKPASPPADRSGLSEFGMGMKSAACWCAREWLVRTSPLGDPHEYLIKFNIDQIVNGNQEELDVIESPADARSHYTEIRLEGLHKVPTGRTVGKIKQHLGDIYRGFTRKGQLDLSFDGDALVYSEPEILKAPFYRTPQEEARIWKEPIDFDFGDGLKVHGFAAIRERASTSRAGFSLFRRGRVIQGSGDEGYRPEFIFGKSNSFAYQRIFGELHLDGFDVSYTKDGFKWDENGEVFLELLKEELSKDSFPLLQQARGFRVLERRDDLQQGAQEASDQTAESVQKNVPPVVSDLRQEPPQESLPENLPQALPLTRREISIDLPPWRWAITIEQTADPAADWIELADEASKPGRDRVRKLGLRMSLAHPFMQRFAGADSEKIEPLLRLGIALCLAETISRESSAPIGGVRRNINELLRRALAQP